MEKYFQLRAVLEVQVSEDAVRQNKTVDGLKLKTKEDNVVFGVILERNHAIMKMVPSKV